MVSMVLRTLSHMRTDFSIEYVMLPIHSNTTFFRTQSSLRVLQNLKNQGIVPTEVIARLQLYVAVETLQIMRPGFTNFVVQVFTI